MYDGAFTYYEQGGFINGAAAKKAFTLSKLRSATLAAVWAQSDLDRDARLNRVEFVTMCNEILSHVPMEQLQLAMDNMTTARKSRARRNRKIWRNTAASCDIWARYFIPVLYFMCLLIVFNLKLTDNYVLDDSNTTIQCESWIRTPGEHDNKTLKSATRADGSCEMFSGLPDIELTPRGWAIIILYIVCCVVVGSLWILVKKLAEKSREKQQNALKIATRQARRPEAERR